MWISKKLPEDISKADYVQNVDQSSLNAGDENGNKEGISNDVALTTPYVIGSEGVYVGYTFTITSASNEVTQYPVLTCGDDKTPNSLFLRTSTSVDKWSDLSGEGLGRLALQILVEGNFAKNSVAPNT